MICRYCEGEIKAPDKPYISKQAAMEGTYHWSCFVEASRSRIPVAIGVVNIPGLDSNSEPAMRSVAASMEE